MKFVSTRDAAFKQYEPCEVIKAGIAPDGGLFFPTAIPKFSKYELIGMMPFSYADRASRVISAYLTDLDKADIEKSCREAYCESSFPGGAAPVVNVGGTYFLELYHGPTCAFKDMALQLMPRLLALSVKRSGAEGDAVILVATSGDTGKAALEGFADVPGTK
ncbi:MAG: threonine synthase, partial [Clostridia bacterium]|nr:threonine synthase [Clostridia bacterium]